MVVVDRIKNEVSTLPRAAFDKQECYRLVNSKFPPISIFDDVASNEEFEDLYAIQALTNPRIQNEVGQINLVPTEERPWGIRGCNYALGPFVHLHPDGSRFSKGDYGIFYAGSNIPTAIAETRYHQEKYLQRVNGLKYDRIIMRGLKATFTALLVDIHIDKDNISDLSGLYHPDDYTMAQSFGQGVKLSKCNGIFYGSVRNQGADCYALLSPVLVTDVIQIAHYEYIFDGNKISGVHQVNVV